MSLNKQILKDPLYVVTDLESYLDMRTLAPRFYERFNADYHKALSGIGFDATNLNYCKSVYCHSLGGTKLFPYLSKLPPECSIYLSVPAIDMKTLKSYPKRTILYHHPADFTLKLLAEIAIPDGSYATKKWHTGELPVVYLADLQDDDSLMRETMEKAFPDSDVIKDWYSKCTMRLSTNNAWADALSNTLRMIASIRKVDNLISGFYRTHHQMKCYALLHWLITNVEFKF